MPPTANNEMMPNLLFPSNLSMLRNGIGSRYTARSRDMLDAECSAHSQKKTSGSLAPQATHVPGWRKFQYLETGRHGKRASMVKVTPQEAENMMRAIVARLALRYCGVLTEVVDSAKRRRYWNRMASLIKPALAQ
jgi:hypothetical protein